MMMIRNACGGVNRIIIDENSTRYIRLLSFNFPVLLKVLLNLPFVWKSGIRSQKAYPMLMPHRRKMSEEYLTMGSFDGIMNFDIFESRRSIRKEKETGFFFVALRNFFLFFLNLFSKGHITIKVHCFNRLLIKNVSIEKFFKRVFREKGEWKKKIYFIFRKSLK